MRKLLGAAVALAVLVPMSGAVAQAQEPTALIVGAEDATDQSASGADTTNGAAQFQDTTDGLNGDMIDLRGERESAQDTVRAARSKVKRVEKRIAKNRKKVDRARRVVGQYLRTIYINGPNDLMLLASIIDNDEPGDLLKRAEAVLRVGDHKDDQFRRAVDLLRRIERSRERADKSMGRALDHLESVEQQVSDLRLDLADVAIEWANQLERGETEDQETAERNSDAATAWAKYLTSLAKAKAPSVTAAQLRAGTDVEGVRVSKKQPGIGSYGKGDDRVLILPEETIRSVTYAVGKLGAGYRWKTNKHRVMDCSALVDRSWAVPSLPAELRHKKRPLVRGGMRGLAQRTALLPPAKRSVGDIVFLRNSGAGVNHGGIAVTNDLIIASDGRTGAVNAIEVPEEGEWRAGRQALRKPATKNKVPGVTKKPFKCGVNPRLVINTPKGGSIATPTLCPAKPGVFGEAHMQASALLVGRCTAMLWPAINTIYGWVRTPIGPYPDHVSGRAVDIMMPGSCSPDPINVGLGNEIAEFFMANAKKFNVQYMMWQHRIWNATYESPKPVSQWRLVSERGDCTSNHMDHVHLSVNGPNVAPGIGSVFDPNDFVDPPTSTTPTTPLLPVVPTDPGPTNQPRRTKAPKSKKDPQDTVNHGPPGGAEPSDPPPAAPAPKAPSAPAPAPAHPAPAPPAPAAPVPPANPAPAAPNAGASQ